MKIEWVLLADGIGQDSRGAVTAIGLNQNVLSLRSLPEVAKRAVIAHIVEDPGVLKVGDKFNVLFRVVAPSGEVVIAQSGQITIGNMQWPDLPVSSDLPAELVWNVSEYGTYRFEVVVLLGGGPEVSGHADFYVVADSSDGNGP